MLPKDLTVFVRSVLYAFRGGFLVRPFAIATALGVTGLSLSLLEGRAPAVSRLAPAVLLSLQQDPQVAQTILSAIATSIMTVVSIVFAILLMTLTLASTQFSPRILISFVRDQVTQWTLGVFLGTFSYCIAVLPAVHALPTISVPLLAVAGSMVLAIICTGWLIYFIHHISQAISVNHIVDRIRRETEAIIEETMPFRRQPLFHEDIAISYSIDFELPIVSRQSGYVRFVDLDRLREIAKAYRICLRLERRVGHFVPEGVVLLRSSHARRVSEEAVGQLLAAIDIGPARTMQQDVEFGIVQIVDIALRAMSPAVNDPTTAISCVDQLNGIVIKWLSRKPPPDYIYDPPHVLRVILPHVGVEGLLDLAFEQIRHYASADAAVSLRLMRAFTDIASTTDDPLVRRNLLDRGKRLATVCRARLQADDFARLEQRLQQLQAAAG